jgi:hypothetical protein
LRLKQWHPSWQEFQLGRFDCLDRYHARRPNFLLFNTMMRKESMKMYPKQILSKFLRRVAIATAASGMAAGIALAVPSGNPIVVPPTKLPASASQSGEAMFLHEAIDGTALLYIEQDQGSRLAIFDVTDPARIKGAGSVEVDAPGPFDFVSSLGSRAELIRFRQSQGNAVLDLHKAKAPVLKTPQGLTLKGAATPVGNDGLTVSSRVVADSQVTEDYSVQVINTASSPELNRVPNVKGVRDEITKYDTGTTFLLTGDGLFVVRRPVKEMDKTLRDLNYAN